MYDIKEQFCQVQGVKAAGETTCHFLFSRYLFLNSEILKISPGIALTLCFGMICILSLSIFGEPLRVFPDVGGEGIQRALDQVGVGGEVELARGLFLVKHPIFLRHDGQTLRGAGRETILRLADNANCPLIIMGSPGDRTNGLRHDLHLSNLLLDGNRTHQQREDWGSVPDRIWMNNNCITVWKVEGATIEHVICHAARSGGLVTSEKTRRLIVRDYESYDNQFDALACYETEDSQFSRLNLHDNPSAGISLDLNFAHNIIDEAVLAGNDLGIFMRQSRNNVFENVTIRRSRHDGVFMAQSAGWTELGWKMVPGTECTGNSFNQLRIEDCARRAFRVNDASCTNNSINGGVFVNNLLGGLSEPVDNLVVARNLSQKPGP